MSSEPRKSKLRRLLGRLGGLACALLVLFFAPSLPTEYRDLRKDLSLQLLDREGRPLRSQLSARDGTDRWIDISHLPAHLTQAVLVSEDRRFHSHLGVDPRAVLRAAWENARARRVVSGASTLTQQLLRTLKPAPNRTVAQKVKEMYWALRLERVFSKQEILEAYLNRVAFGPTVYGVEEASRYYFDKPARALSLSESTLLAVLIRAPATFDPFSEEGRQELRTWTNPLLARMVEEGLVTPEAAERAQSEPWELSHLPPPFQAPHFCDLAMPKLRGARGSVKATLDLGLQRKVEGLVRTHLALLEGHRVSNCAVVIAEVDSGEILALVGSPDYHRRGDGQHNAAVSVRQPGSTLKPFTYALLMQQEGNPGTILPDLPLYESSDRESFIPQNYDGKFHGPVSARTALGCSYNVPAVRALERVGVDDLLSLLRRLGMDNLTEAPDHYGLGLTLGDGSVSLLQLVAAYRTLARGGVWSPLTTLGRESQTDERVLDARIAALVTDMLSDRTARIPSFGTPNVLELPFPCAVKTGTSKGYRDNWTVGYTPRHVVGVWVGNSDGTPMMDVSGITGAGPLFRDLMLTLGDGGDFIQPQGLKQQKVCSLSGGRANEDCPQVVIETVLDDAPIETCQVCRRNSHGLVFDLDPLYTEWAQIQGIVLANSAPTDDRDQFRLVFPLNGDVFLRDADLKDAFQRVRFRAVGGEGPYRWSVDGLPTGTSAEPNLWWVLQPGEHEVSVSDAASRADSVRIEVTGRKG